MKRLGKKQITELEIILIGSFLVLSTYAALTPFFNIDLQISKTIQSLKFFGFPEIMWIISMVGNNPWIVLATGLVFFLLYQASMRTELYATMFAVIGSVTIGTMAKFIIHRPRPDPDIINVLVRLSDKSFPSNHVLIFTAFFGFLLYLSLYVFKRSAINILFSIVLTSLVLGVGVSRIFLGAHWASDVVGGYLLGLLWLIVTIRIYKQATNS